MVLCLGGVEGGGVAVQGAFATREHGVLRFALVWRLWSKRTAVRLSGAYELLHDSRL